MAGVPEGEAGDCPVCKRPSSVNDGGCAVCGFPSSLIDRLEPAWLRASDLGPTGPSAASDARRTGAVVAPTAPAAGPATDGILRNLRALQRLGEDSSPVDAALAEAAVRDALAEPSASADSLADLDRTARAALVAAVDRRSRDLVSRRQLLASGGIDAGPSADLPTSSSSLIDENPEQAAALLADETARLTRLEHERTTVAELRNQIARIRTSAALLGLTPESQPADPLTTSLSNEPDPALPSPEDELRDLTDRLTPVVKAELDRHADALAAFPPGSGEGERARAVREHAAGELAEGRLASALGRLQDLRAALVALSKDPNAPASPALEAGAEPPADEPGGGPGKDVSIDSLLAKARGFADRIRSLPPGSEAGRRAARQIHEATDLLRQGRLAEADVTLSRLMVELDEPQVHG